MSATVNAVAEVRRWEGEEDKRFFLPIVRADHDARIRLDVRGADEESTFRDDAWSACFVAEIDGERAGFARVRHDSFAGRACFADLYVLPEFRLRGVGSALIEARLDFLHTEWAVPNGIYAMTIENTPMERLLQRYGFRCFGTYRKWLIRGGRRYDQSLWLREWDAE